MFRNLTTELLRHGKITTTEAKAKAIRPQAERLITLAKRGDLHARRWLPAMCRTRGVAEAFDELAERYEDREGGYVRVYKLGRAQG